VTKMDGFIRMMIGKILSLCLLGVDRRAMVIQVEEDHI